MSPSLAVSGGKKEGRELVNIFIRKYKVRKGGEEEERRVSSWLPRRFQRAPLWCAGVVPRFWM